MLPITVQLLVAISCFTAAYLPTEAANTCPVRATSCIPGPPGRDGAKGRDGRDGLPGPPGTLTFAERQLLKEEILDAIREEIRALNCCNGTQPPHEITKPPCSGRSEDNPATSCKLIYECNPTTVSGYYWVSTDSGPQQVYCEMNTDRCGNITGGWTRVAHVNMTDPQQTCPSDLRNITSPLRMCTGQTGVGCTSVYFPTLDLNFTQVCGRAGGYQYNSPDGLDAVSTSKTIDNPYVDGLSITYGTPRQHLWTYAAGHNGRCACQANSGAAPPPSFVGQHFYCDGWPQQWQVRWHTEHRLWDGDGCPTENTCCDAPNLPWFHRELNTVITNDIEVRWCRDQSTGDEDVGIDLLELYVY